MDEGFERSIDYLYGLQSHGIKPGLSRTLALLEAMGNPERRLRALHVAGTNGKGSTAAMLAAMLERQGYRTGLYTSPHLIEFTERIRVNGRRIPADHVAWLTGQVRAAAESHLAEMPTFFEAVTVMALAYFAEQAVDCAVVEVGLGGRFDATNVLIPLVSVITTIGMDHQEYLGSTPEAIAFEKAGIIKPGVPVVIGRLAPGPLSVVREAAAERRSAHVVLGKEFDVCGEDSGAFTYRGITGSLADLSCALPGRHQMENAACALAALELAGERGLPVGPEAIREGLRTVRWPGRLELAGRRPDIWLDGAHNPHAAEALAAHLTAVMTGTSGKRRLILVLGMMRDKDRRDFLTILARVPGVSHCIFTQASHPRAASAEELARDGAELGIPCAVRATVAEAFSYARTLATPDDAICVTGSLLVVGEAKAQLEGTTVSGLRG